MSRDYTPLVKRTLSFIELELPEGLTDVPQHTRESAKDFLGSLSEANLSTGEINLIVEMAVQLAIALALPVVADTNNTCRGIVTKRGISVQVPFKASGEC